MTPDEYIASFDNETRQNYEKQLRYHPNLCRTTWTAKQVAALDQAHDDHLDECDVCLSTETPEPDDHQNCLEHPEQACYLDDYCLVGKKTLKAWLDADVEYRWQPNFPGKDDS